MMDGQITISDYLATKIMKRDVMDLTCWINNQGKCQFDQISDVIEKSGLIDDPEQIYLLTNKISCYVLTMSLGYMEYLRQQCS